MKFLFALLTILGAAQSQALSPRWFKIMECNRGELVVDEAMVYSDPRPVYQLVLRGQPLQHFVRSGAIDKKYVNNKGEFILQIYSHGYGELSGSAYHGKSSTGSYVYRYYEVKKNFDEVTLRAFANSVPDANEMANWIFRGCRSQTSRP